MLAASAAHTRDIDVADNGSGVDASSSDEGIFVEISSDATKKTKVSEILY